MPGTSENAGSERERRERKRDGWNSRIWWMANERPLKVVPGVLARSQRCRSLFSWLGGWARLPSSCLFLEERTDFFQSSGRGDAVFLSQDID